EAIDRPQVEVQELERGRAARFVARVSVMPEVALPDLDALHVERARTEVDDEMLERRLRELRERLAQVEPVEREVRVGDVVVGDLRVLVRGGGEQPTAEALRTAVRADLEAQARRLDELTFEQAAVKAVVDGARVELPQSLVDREVDRRLEDVDRGLQQRGLRLDRYLQYLNK